MTEGSSNQTGEFIYWPHGCWSEISSGDGSEVTARCPTELTGSPDYRVGGRQRILPLAQQLQQQLQMPARENQHQPVSEAANRTNRFKRDDLPQPSCEAATSTNKFKRDQLPQPSSALDEMMWSEWTSLVVMAQSLVDSTAASTTGVLPGVLLESARAAASRGQVAQERLGWPLDAAVAGADIEASSQRSRNSSRGASGSAGAASSAGTAASAGTAVGELRAQDQLQLSPVMMKGMQQLNLQLHASSELPSLYSQSRSPSQSASQSISQSISQSVSLLVNHPLNHPLNRPLKHPLYQPSSHSVSQSISHPVICAFHLPICLPICSPL